MCPKTEQEKKEAHTLTWKEDRFNLFNAATIRQVLNSASSGRYTKGEGRGGDQGFHLGGLSAELMGIWPGFLKAPGFLASVNRSLSFLSSCCVCVCARAYGHTHTHRHTSVHMGTPGG